VFAPGILSNEGQMDSPTQPIDPTELYDYDPYDPPDDIIDAFLIWLASML
jgi:hypothetical protein